MPEDTEGLTLAFLPLYERHAIAEVVFALQVSPAISQEDREKLKEAHASLEALLPKIVEPAVVAIAVSPPVPPLQFVRHKADGSLDSRLHVMEENIVVNCLEYTRWPNVWEHAKELFAFVARILPETTVMDSAYLQYVNVFSWHGKTEDYDSRMLLDERSSFVPGSVLDQGPHWHLHQGWFSPVDGTLGRRLLDRMHIDAIDDQQGTHVVKLESFHRFDFGKDSRVRIGDAFQANDKVIDVTFNKLHDRTKASLRSFLTVEVQRSINLHAT